MSSNISRRSFIGAGAAALAGCATAKMPSPAAVKPGHMPDMIWAVMFKLGGNNMAGENYLTADWKAKNPKSRHRIRYKELFFDESIWREATERMAKGGWAPHRLAVRGYCELERYGYDQIPTGSNWSTPENMKGTVEFCRKHIAPERLKGFMTASWKRCLPGEEGEKLLASIDQIVACKAAWDKA